MNPNHPSEDEIFEQALQLSGEARAAYLKEATGGDEQLRQRIENLLQANASAGTAFLNEPAVVSAKTLVINTGMVPVTEKPGDKIGRYKLREQIGEGGCGVVYVAEQEEPVRRRVALKVIKLGMDTRQVVARFEAERQALALMDHPNIAKVLDAGATDTGRPYFVMELVRGIKITDYCDKNNLSTEERLKLFIQVCSAIQHAHQKGIIHRDIKPSNILVTLHDGVPVPKVIDFGIAKATSDQRLTDKTIYTAFEQFIGTPAYMSPEQAEMSGLDIDTRSDIYSLGVLLYELLTGQTPFDAATLLKAGLDQMRRIIREQEPQRPSTRLSTLEHADLTAIAQHRQAEPPKLVGLIRGDLDWIVMKALEKDRTRRFETVNALAMDLQRHLCNEPVVARPPSQIYRLWKMVQRNRVAFAAAAVIVVVLVSGVLASTWQALRATKAEREQSHLRALAEKERLRAEVESNEAQSQTKNANRERGRADEQAKIAIDALQQIKIQRAEDMFKSDNTSLALATLAQVIRQNPSNRVAAERIMAALAQRNFLLPRFQRAGSNQVAEFSPDGRRLACVNSEYGLEILDAHTGRKLVGPVALSNTVQTIGFNPDGTQLLTASSKQITLWNAANLIHLKDSAPFSRPIYSAHFTPQGPRVVSVQGSTVWILDGMDGRELIGPLQKTNNPGFAVEDASFSRDGTRLIVSFRNSLIRVWNATNGTPITDLLDLGGAGPSLALSPDGNSFVVGSWGSFEAYVVDTAVAPPKRFLLEHSACIPCVDFSPDGRNVATGSDDGIARIWEAATGRLINDSIHRDGGIRTTQFDPTGQRLLTKSTDHTIRLWEASTGRPASESLRYEGALSKVKIAPDGTSLLLESDTEIQIWDLRHGGELAEPTQDSEEDDELVISPDKKLEARLEGFYNGSPTQARIIDRQTKMPVSDKLYFEANIWSARFSPDSQRLVLGIGFVNGDDRGRAEVFEARTGKKLIELPVGDWAAKCAEFSPNGRLIATGSKEGKVRVWAAQTGKPITEPLEQDGGDVDQVIFSPDSSLLLTVGSSRTARLWNATNGTKLLELRHDGNINDAKFSPDGKHIITVGDDRVARIWETITGRMLQDLRHEAPVMCVALSPDGRTLATGSRDSVARVWDANTGQQLMEASAPPKPDPRKGLYSLRIVEDGQRLEVGTGVGMLLWDIPSAPIPAPSWLAELAEALGGQCLGDRLQTESVSSRKLFALKEWLQVNEGSNQDPYSQWAKWFFADRTTRSISPLSKITVRDYLENCITNNSIKLFDFNAAEQLSGGDSELQQHIASASKKLQLFSQAFILHERAHMLRTQNNYSEAEAAFREALAIRKKLFGNENEGVAGTIFDFATMLECDEGRFSEAESLYREALGIRRKLLGNEHHDVADALDALARVLEAQDKLAEAESTLREVVEIRFGTVDNKRRSPYEQWYPDSITRLAFILRKLGKIGDVQRLYGDIVSGGNVDWMNAIAWRLATSPDSKLRDGTNAVALARKAVLIANLNDPNLLDTLAAAYGEAGQFDKAVTTQKEAIKLYQNDEQNPSYNLEELRASYTARLKLFESGKPYHKNE